MKKRNLFFFVLCFFSLATFAQAPIDICENVIPSNWVANNGRLSLSEKHFKQGHQSIRWDWTAKNASLNITDTAFENVISNKRSSFTIWIYNETPVKDSLQFHFKKDNNTACSFSFQLDFKGWRTAWVMYNRDMKGAPVLGMNNLSIVAPASENKGSLFFDAVQYDVDIDPRAPMRDMQVPFINPVSFNKSANAHWVNLLQFSQFPDYLKAPNTITKKDIADIKTIRQRYENIILPDQSIQKNQLKSITKAFDEYDIKRDGNNITGKPISSINEYEINHKVPIAEAKEYAQEYGVQKASTLLLKIAFAYRSNDIDNAEKSTLSTQFLDLLDQMHDQGWAFGSGMGSAHHLGYNFKSYFSACLLMRDVLKKSNRLERTQRDMYWFSGQGRTHQLPKLLPSSNIDVFNTLLGGMLASILMLDDSPQKVLQLEEFTQWLSNNIGPEYSIEGTFKPGGSVTHHGTLYPAYAIDGLKGLTPVIYVLSNTSFQITNKAYDVVKESLLMMHRYTNPLYWLLSVSGRHPGEGKILANPFAYMAMAGGPKLFDTTMASIYLQITNAESAEGEFAKDFKNKGIKPSGFPVGHWDMNYGLLSIHRRDNWLLTVRGHNRYFVANESYPGANVFGRYLTYGNLELFYPNDQENKGSYFKDKGWDWNDIPGTTTLHLPLDKLRANIINADDFSGVEEMLLTDEIFAGGTHLGNQGIYGMKLHGNDKYDMGSFHANKSWFMFDSLIICLGSDITNTIKEYPTETTLFQNYLTNDTSPVFIGEKRITAFPYEQKWKSSPLLTVIDNRKTGYYIPDAKNVIFTKSMQNSRNQQDTKDTKGAFAKMVIDHGNAPSGSTYEYAMLINTDSAKMKQFVSGMTSNPAFKVLQQDSLAHIVYYTSQKLTGCVLFTNDKPTKDSLIISNDRPCLLMYQKQKNEISLSVTDPDLGFYAGPDDTPILPNGKRKEVSIYSKTWYDTPAKPSVVKLVVKGEWKLKEPNKEVTIISDKKGNSILQVQCKHGEASLFKLVN